MATRYLISEVARILKVRIHKIVYAVTQGMVPEPKERFNRTRVFKDEDVQRLREYFQSRSTKMKKKKELETP